MSQQAEPTVSEHKSDEPTDREPDAHQQRPGDQQSNEGTARDSQQGAEAEDTSTENHDRRQHRQSVALLILVVMAVLYMSRLARPILMPVLIAVILTLLLRPLVRRCRRYLPDAVSAAMAVSVLVLILFAGIVNLIGPAREWIENAPSHMQVVGEKLSVVREQIERINLASSKVRDLAEGDEDQDGQEGSLIEETIREWTGKDAAGQQLDAEAEKPVPVEVRQPTLATGLSFLSVTGGFLAGLVITFVLTYFLLATGDRLLNNVLHVLPTFRDKRNVVEMVYEVERGVSSYLVTVTLINIALGVVIGVAMWLMGLPNPALWGAMATVLNFIPYFGAMTGTIVVFLVAVFTFDSLSYALLVPVVYFVCTALEGNLITPLLLGRRMSMSPVVVFLSLIFWGWMWGIGGALIAVPMLAILKIAFDQFERTRPLGTLLGG